MRNKKKGGAAHNIVGSADKQEVMRSRAHLVYFHPRIIRYPYPKAFQVAVLVVILEYYPHNNSEK